MLCHKFCLNTVLHMLRDHGVSFGQEKEKAHSAVLGRAIGENAPYSFFFIPLREPTSAPTALPPSLGRRESRITTSLPFLLGEGSDARIPFPRTVISSVSEKSFSFAVKQCMRVNQNGKPDTPRIWDTVFHVNGLAYVSRKRQQQRSLGCARDDDTRGGIVLRK